MGNHLKGQILEGNWTNVFRKWHPLHGSIPSGLTNRLTFLARGPQGRPIAHFRAHRVRLLPGDDAAGGAGAHLAPRAHARGARQESRPRRGGGARQNRHGARGAARAAGHPEAGRGGTMTLTVAAGEHGSRGGRPGGVGGRWTYHYRGSYVT